MTSNSAPRGVFLLALDFVDAQTGWAAGSNGAILATIDGGKNWVQQNSGLTNHLTDVQFLNRKLGWASGFTKKIVRTIDGGQTWHQIDTGVIDTPNRSICFVDSLHGWLVGGDVLESGWILHSNNGGLTWRHQTPGSIPPLNDLSFVDSLRGWVVGDEGYLAITEDGGRSWRMQDSNGSARLGKVHFASRYKGWILYGEGNILLTNDGGQHWDKMFVGGFEGGLWDLTFTDEQHGWICGGIGVVFATTDGGMTWREQFTGTKSSFSAIDFVNSQQGWIAGVQSTILMTSSGGVTSVNDKTLEVVANSSFEIMGNYPNPFNPATQITYEVLKAGHLQLTVYNVKGMAIKTLVNDHHLPGTYSVEWDGRDHQGHPVATGVYFYKLSNGKSVSSGKMLLLR